MRVLDDTLIRRLAADSALVKEFPVLRAKSGQARPNRGCCGQPSKSPDLDYARIKKFLVSLPPGEQTRVLSVAGLTRARVIYRDGAKTVDLTIGLPT
jgi:hypothetical protein